MGSSYVGSGGYVTAGGDPFMNVSSWSLLSPAMPISIVRSTCPTKVVVSPRRRQCREESWESCRSRFLTAQCCTQLIYDKSIE